MNKITVEEAIAKITYCLDLTREERGNIAHLIQSQDEQIKAMAAKNVWLLILSGKIRQ